ncbi:hypothetical protein B6D18_12295, partial [Gilliamella sp. A7]
SDIKTWSRIQSYLRENYDKEDKQDIIELVYFILIKLKIRLLIEYLKNFKYKEIRDYLNKDFDLNYDLISLSDKFLHKSDRKKFNIIKRNNLIVWLWGSLYYRYVRRDIRK